MQDDPKREENIVKIEVEAAPAKRPVRKKPKPKKNVVKIEVEAKQPKQPAHKKVKKVKKISIKGYAIPKKLMENFVALQRVQTNLAEKLDNLAKQLSELLRLFETTAKTFAENPAVLTAERDTAFVGKINELLEQNKVIAKGVVYIEDRVDAIEKSASGKPLPQEPPQPV